MPTKRKRIRRKKTLRGGKTNAENISNCENYWSHGKARSRCAALSSVIDYPGMKRKAFGDKPTYTSNAMEEGQVRHNEW